MEREELENKLKLGKEIALALDKSVEELDRIIRRLITHRDKAYVQISALEEELRRLDD